MLAALSLKVSFWVLHVAKGGKDNSTQCSQAVTHPSTNRAQRCLTSVIGRELVFSTWYGRCQRQRAVFLGLIKILGCDITPKDNSTQCSQAVTHPSTNRAQRCLTSVIGRELVFSTWYGRCQRQRTGFLGLNEILGFVFAPIHELQP